MSTSRDLVDGAVSDRIDVRDRGLLYGDGVFETCLFVNGHAPLWPRHVERLRESCARLHLPRPEVAKLEREAVQVSAGMARAVVRMTLTRGSGERGYAAPRAMQPTRIVSAFPAPASARDWYRCGIRVRFCTTRLAAQPLLAGIKHLNRLEQVLARAEWDDTDIVEGMMCDTSGKVIGATAANVFAVIDGRLVTPALDRCGVAGVMRAEVMVQCAPVAVREIGVDELMRAEEIFLTNAVRGVMPVTALESRTWPIGPIARRLIAHTQAIGLLPEDAC
jgi:4-amino-4-deoxychorismate lyase